MNKYFLILIAVILTIIFVYRYADFNGEADDFSNDKEEVIENEVEIEEKNEEVNKLNDNKKNMDLEIKIIQEGAGDKVVKNGDTIFVHYTGKLTDGTKFDSSVDRGMPFEFKIGEGMVIEGWEKGFLDMKVGEKRILTIPSEMGYGSRGAGGTIPPNATLIFDVELIAIK